MIERITAHRPATHERSPIDWVEIRAAPPRGDEDEGDLPEPPGAKQRRVATEQPKASLEEWG